MIRNDDDFLARVHHEEEIYLAKRHRTVKGIKIALTNALAIAIIMGLGFGIYTVSVGNDRIKVELPNNEGMIEGFPGDTEEEHNGSDIVATSSETPPEEINRGTAEADKGLPTATDVGITEAVSEWQFHLFTDMEEIYAKNIAKPFMDKFESYFLQAISEGVNQACHVGEYTVIGYVIRHSRDLGDRLYKLYDDGYVMVNNLSQVYDLSDGEYYKTDAIYKMYNEILAWISEQNNAGLNNVEIKLLPEGFDRR